MTTRALHRYRTHLRFWIPAWFLLGACNPRSETQDAAGARHRVLYRPENAAASAELAAPAENSVPDSTRRCATCHPSVVAAYLENGMARSLGPAGLPEPGVAVNPRNGYRYEITTEGESPLLRAVAPDGAERRQRLVGRIGAGILDISWVAAEIHPFEGTVLDRLFVAPVETITGHGLELSPFELHPSSPAVDFALTNACLTCHTTGRLDQLPRAATSDKTDGVFPSNHLGRDAFESLSPITCDSCHGDPRAHLEKVSRNGGTETGIGLRRLGSLPAGEQRDVCARCHLQGDLRIDLVGDDLRTDRPLAGQIPVLVPVQPNDDFRFVSQLERLALSSCFQGSPDMTCTTCHDAHLSVERQGLVDLEAACAQCHDACVRPSSLGVEDVTGNPSRTTNGCVDCHMRRSQPFDLPHVVSADHAIRRLIPKPRHDVPHRQFADARGALRLFDDGRLANQLTSAEGRQWESGIQAMGLVTLLRPVEAARLLSRFPEPGTRAAITPTAPSGLTPLESAPSFHQVRALTLQTTGRFQEALGAYSDALKLDRYAAGARLARARVRLDTGDVQGALEDSDFLVANFPRSEAPWDLRSAIALKLRRPDLGVAALSQSTSIWPSNPQNWHQLAQHLSAVGIQDQAQGARARGQQLPGGRNRR